MVSISMSPVVVDNTRSEQIRKRSAEAAYTRHADYTGGNESKRNEVAKQMTRPQDTSEISEAAAFEKLGAGQLKQVALPLGETLEETITSWQNVRREALSTADSSEVDHQLAAAASAKIMETEGQLALENRQRSMQLAEASMTDTYESNSTQSDKIQKLYDRATVAYSLQIEAQQRGYEMEHPAFSQIA